MVRRPSLRPWWVVVVGLALLMPVPAGAAGGPSTAPGPSGTVSLAANLTFDDQGGRWNCAQGTETIAFFGHAQGGAPPYRYLWNFGDGSPPAPVQDPVHAYTSPQAFNVTFGVVDSANASTSSSAWVSWGIPELCTSSSSNVGSLLLYGVLIVGIAGGGFLVVRARRRPPSSPPLL